MFFIFLSKSISKKNESPNKMTIYLICKNSYLMFKYCKLLFIFLVSKSITAKMKKNVTFRKTLVKQKKKIFICES